MQDALKKIYDKLSDSQAVGIDGMTYVESIKSYQKREQKKIAQELKNDVEYY